MGYEYGTPLGEEKTGRVARVVGDYGFIACDEFPNQDLYFKTSWFRGSPPLREGESVTFDIKAFGSNLQAHYPRRAATDGTSAPLPVRGTPATLHIFDWAYLGYLPNTLSELAGLALKERWGFNNVPQNPERPH